jgi:TolA-binding protein
MSSRSRAQILAGIGIGGLLTATTVATGVRAAAAKSWLLTAGVGAVSAVAIWAGVRASAPDPQPAAAPVTVPARPVAPRTPTTPATTPVAPEPEAAPVVAAAPVRAPVRATPSERDLSLTQELGAIEQARAAFLRHEYSQTLRLLDEYGKKFPKRQLASEATVLRIEALAARGDRDSASRIGRDFLQNHPNGPYAQRVRSVIGDGARAQ